VKWRIEDMPAKEPGFAERLQTAANAKKAQLQKIRSSAPPDGARSTERQAAQAEAVAARKIRTAGRKDSDRMGAEQRVAQRAAENARQALAVVDERARKEAERGAKAQADATLKKNQKAARDVKYAARKVRQK
jgi:hypothetical protein